MSATQKTIETEIVRLLADAERPMTADAMRPGAPSAVRAIDYEVALLTLLDRGVLSWHVANATLYYRLAAGHIDGQSNAVFIPCTDGQLMIFAARGELALTTDECRALRRYLAPTMQPQRGAA